MRNALLVAWVALLSATRVDFLGGNGPFILTPFLVLSPALFLLEAWHLAREGWRLRVPPQSGGFLLIVWALLMLLLVSTFASYDLAMSARRFSLLFVQVCFVFAIGVILANRPDPARILARGGMTGLAVALLFDVGQAVYWLREDLWPRVAEDFVSLEPGVYLGVIPRFTGLSHDPNHGGLAIVFFLALVVLFSRASVLRNVLLGLGALAVVLTLSRSAVLAAGVLGGGLLLVHRRVSFTPAGVGAACLVAAMVTGLYVVMPGIVEPAAEQVGEVVGSRISSEEGSASEHALLLARGWEVGTRNLKHVFFGIGYGNAYVTVQDIFPGNDYGNFHSLFVTFFAEAGVFAALVAVGLFAYVLFTAGPYWPLIAALLAFNFFQQSHTDPVLWFSLMMAWMGVGLRAPWERSAAVAGDADGRGGPAPTVARTASWTALLAVVTLLGCSDIVTEPFDYGTVEVYTERPSGEPVPGVHLTLYTGTRHLGLGFSGETNPFVFDLVPMGGLGVAAIAPEGYELPSSDSPGYDFTTFEMEEGERKVVRFTLEPRLPPESSE